MSDTRRELLRKLLQHKESGLTTHELSRKLRITQTAVQQHLTRLERDGLVAPVQRRSTGGRPSRAFGLTESGYEEFPRNYAMLAQALLAAATEKLGEEAVEELLAEMASRMAEDVKPQLQPKGDAERLEAVIDVMNELGYDASSLPDGGISAVNCVYHKLAEKTRAVCRFDVRLLSLLLGREVEQRRCMMDGDGECIFHFLDGP